MSIKPPVTRHPAAPAVEAMESIAVGSEVSIVRSNRVVLDGTIRPAEIIISNGKITSILPRKGHTPTKGAKSVEEKKENTVASAVGIV